jgi:ureidoglycolate hydrolase
MSKAFEINVKALSPKAFLPFGQVIGAPDREPDYAAGHLRGWHLDYESEGETIFLFIHYEQGPLECHSLERHFKVTQSFVALSDAPSVMVVAAPTSGGALPRPEDVQAFYVPGSCGIMLWKATWHALTRFPLRPSGATFAFLSEGRTQQELEDAQNGGPVPTLTQKIELPELYGCSLRIVDPDGLLKV